MSNRCTPFLLAATCDEFRAANGTCGAAVSGNALGYPAPGRSWALQATYRF